MNLANVDLNLLVVFEALYQTRNVTAAGRRLNRAQPSVSNALARLRTLLNDPLFVRSGGGMAPTPRAHQLMPQIRQVLEQIHRRWHPCPFRSGHRRATALYAGGRRLCRYLAAARHHQSVASDSARHRYSRFASDRHNIYRQLDRGEVDIALGGHLSGTESHYVRTLFEEHRVHRQPFAPTAGGWPLGSGALSQPAAWAVRTGRRRLCQRIGRPSPGGNRRPAARRRNLSHIVALPAVVADSDLIATPPPAWLGAFPIRNAYVFSRCPTSWPSPLSH